MSETVAIVVLEVLGLLLLAAGAAAAVFPFIGWAALMVSGTFVLVGAWVAARGR